MFPGRIDPTASRPTQPRPRSPPRRAPPRPDRPVVCPGFGFDSCVFEMFVLSFRFLLCLCIEMNVPEGDHRVCAPREHDLDGFPPVVRMARPGRFRVFLAIHKPPAA